MKKWLLLLTAVVLLLVCAACSKQEASSGPVQTTAVQTPETEASKYSRAQSMLAKNQFAEAAALFDELGSYEESTKLSMYSKAAASGESGNYDEAYSGFQLLGEFKDSPYMITYYKIRAVESSACGEADQWKNWISAANSYDRISIFRDSRERAETCRNAAYVYAESLETTGDREGAYAVFKALGDYSDSAERADRTYYDLGLEKRAAGNWEEAIAAFGRVSGYSDAAEQISETRYQQAIAILNAGDYIGTYNILCSLKGYKDVDRFLAEDDRMKAAAAREVRLEPYQKAGNYVTFGTYPQTAAGTDNTPIEWMVLTYDAANQRALLLSRYGLDAKPYNAQSEVVSWETCSLRAWLNGDFIKRAFSAEQQAAILLTEVDNSNGQGYVLWKRGSNSTQDRVFLLSYEEAYKYFGVTNYSGEKKARAAATQYALRTGISYYENYKTNDGSSACTWWLRSPGKQKTSAAAVYCSGELDSLNVSKEDIVVRPVLWLDLTADIF